MEKLLHFTKKTSIIEKGKMVDLVILSEDPLNSTSEELLNIRIEKKDYWRKIVYDKENSTLREE